MTTDASKPVKPLPTPAKTATVAAVKPEVKSAKAVASKVASKTPKAPTAKPKALPAPKVTAKPAGAPQAAKVKKPKMVRDSFTFPKEEYAVLDLLKLRAAKLGSPVKKTELLRAGVKAIAMMSDDAFLLALRAVPSLKTGRPAKNKTA
jgi:hypothetical protein